MFQRQPLTIAILAASLGLVACNSNDHDTTPAATTTVTVTPSLGKILSGRVVLRDAKTGVDLAPAKTLTPADNGTATFTVPIAKLAEPVIAAVLPNLQGKIEYADEAIPTQATTITVAPTDINKPILRAAASLTANANLGVTALTEAAVQQAEKAVGGLIAQNINQANAAVKNQLQLNFDITQAPIVVGLGEFDKLINAALDQQRRAYATYLTTLAKEAKRINSGSLTPAYDVAKAFADDFSHDGTFNAVGSKPLALAYNAQFINAWLNWVTNFYSAFIKFNNANVLNTWLDNFNAVTPPAIPLRVVEGIAEYSCNDAAKLRSGSGADLDIDFVNQSGVAINIDWITFNGDLNSYSSNLASGQTYTIHPTHISHPWKVSNTQGQCIGIYTPVTATKKTITFKSNEVILAGVAAPVDTGNTDTCASLGANPSTLSEISDFVGNYEVTASGVAKSNFQVMANGDISLKGQSAQLKEVCKNTTQSNGQGYRLITNKASILLFRETNNALLAEGKDFVNTATAGVFEGYKQVIVDPLKPIRTTNGVEVYACDSWTKIPNGVADGTPTISFVNNVGANSSLTLLGLNSIQKTTTIFTGIQNGATRQQTALKNQFVKVETGGGECLGVFKATTNDDKTINFKPTGVVEITNSAGANNCTSLGADNTLGFTNAPNDFCGFTSVTSTALSSPNIYTFLAADGKTNTKITTSDNGTVLSASVENNKYSFACGLGGEIPSCSNTVSTAVSATHISFTFTKTTLSTLSGANGIVIGNGSLIHMKAVTPPATATCTGNTNPYGCLTITGTNAPASIYEFHGDGTPLFQSAAANTGAITYPAKGLAGGNLIVNGMAVGFQKIVGSTQNSTYTFFQYDSSFNILKSINMKCRDTNNDCAGLTVNNVDKTVSYNNVVMTDVNGTGAQLTFNGTLKY